MKKTWIEPSSWCAGIRGYCGRLLLSITTACAAILCLAVSLHAQQVLSAASTQPEIGQDYTSEPLGVQDAALLREQSSRRWQDPDYLFATTLLGDLREDEQSFTSLQNAILSARVGEAWFKINPEAAHAELRFAVRMMEMEAQSAGAATAAQRAEAVRILLKIIMPLDGLLGERLLKLQTAVAESPELSGQSVSSPVQNSDRWQQTTQFLDVARSMISQNPKMAADLARNIIGLRGSKGVESLSGSGEVHAATLARSLFSQLRAADPATAETLFMDAVAGARTDFDYSLMFALSEIAFPSVTSPAYEPVPASLQSAVLDLLSEAARGGTGAGTASSFCGVSSIAVRLTPFYDPPRTADLQSAINLCQANTVGIDHPDELVNTALTLTTSDDFWAAAENEPLVKKRVHYKVMAAIKALQENKDPIRALEIWDSFSTEERQAEPSWARDRLEAAEKAILECYKLHDALFIERAIERTPVDAQPELQLKVGAALLAQDDRGLGMRMLGDARGTLEQVEVNDPTVYLMLLTTYAEWLPAETPVAFTVAVAGLNRIPMSRAAGDYGKPSRGYDFSPFQFASSMLNMDADFIRHAINTLVSPTDRARFRLGYAHAALERYAAHERRKSVARVQSQPPRPPIAEQIAKTYGLDSFAQIEGIRYTFNAEFPGVKISEAWEWEPKTGKVSYEGKDKMGNPVRVKYVRSQLDSQSAQVKDEIDPAFINDQYWLLFPLHVSWDGSAVVEDAGMHKMPLGKGSAERVIVKYPSEGGYTPGDTWELYVGTDNRVQEFIYHRGGPKKPSVVIASWAGYKEVGPLLISTDHRGTADSKPLRVFFSDVAVKLTGSDTWMKPQ